MDPLYLDILSERQEHEIYMATRYPDLTFHQRLPLAITLTWEHTQVQKLELGKLKTE